MEALYKKYSGSGIDRVGGVLLNDVVLPRWLVSSQIRILLADVEAWNAAADRQPLFTAPGLTDVLASDSPPSIDFFKTLPQTSTTTKQWGLYALLLERLNSRPKLYIGTGTHAVDSVHVRARNYKSGNGPFSLETQKALDDGYRISSFGLLCWIDLPLPEDVLRQRARLLTLETVLAIHFNACRRSIIDSLYISDFYVWDRAAVAWDPLCTHLSIQEKVALNVNLSDEELKVAAVARNERDRQRSARWRKMKRDEDETGFNNRINTARRARYAKQNGPTGVHTRAKESGLYRCELCQKNFSMQHELNVHFKRKSHIEAVDSDGQKDLTATQIKVKAYNKAYRAATKASKKFYCSICDKFFSSKGALEKHNNSTVHKTRAACLTQDA